MVEYEAWSVQYERIRAEFGFPWEAEERSAQRLRALLPPAARSDPLARLAVVLRGRLTVVVGLAPDAGPPPLWQLPQTIGPVPAVVAADGAAATCARAGLIPEVVVTDLDGPVASEASVNAKGALVVIHAHGDNRAAIERWVPEFHGPLAGSWAGPPGDGLIDVGGFTDGDRAVFAAEHVGSGRILLWGFDFDRVDAASVREEATKRAKLRWARELLLRLSEQSKTPIELWSRDGSIGRFR